MSTVKMSKVVEKMNLKNLTPDVDHTDKQVKLPDINRPALQLSGFFKHFASERVQIIGYVEYSYLKTLDEEKKKEVYETFMSYEIPCLIFCRNLRPDELLLESQIENLVVAKGYADCVAFMGENGVSIVVAAAEDGLQTEDAAKIMDIVLSETDYKADQIKIMEAD